MRDIIGFIKTYFKETDKIVLSFSTLFIAVLIFLNYQYSLEPSLLKSTDIPYPAITGRWLIFAIAYYVPIALILIRKRKNNLRLKIPWVVLLLLAPLIFAIKAGIETNWILSPNTDWNHYWNQILYWPVRGLLVAVILLIIYQWHNTPTGFYGLSAKKLKLQPYIVMLLIMIPLIAAASTQADFLAIYPKMQRILPLPDGAEPSWWYKLLYELSYGSDFFSIELFFRGFLIIGMVGCLGKNAILPMACFYCTIHFGKPLGECISSYFGGLLLGIVSYHTRSIIGGLMVHLGIAWLMELGGFLGNRQ